MTDESFSSKVGSFNDTSNSPPPPPVEEESTSTEVATTGVPGETVDGTTDAEPIEASTVVNTAFVPPEEKDVEEYDSARDGGNAGERREVTMGFMSQQHLDPARQADPRGVYYDDQQRRQAEIIRAQGEGREPDLENPPPTVGDPMISVDVAKQHNYQGAVVQAEFELPVVVGDYERDENGDAIVDDSGEEKNNE